MLACLHAACPRVQIRNEPTMPFPPLLSRTTEPELMNDAEQALAYAEADFAVSHEGVVDEFAASWRRLMGTSTPTGIALDIGCGPGDVVIRMARRFPTLIIDGVDGADAMLALGRERVAAAGFANRLRLYRAFLPSDPLPRTTFDVVSSNSILHHLHDPQALWTTVRRASRPGTMVFVMDLIRPNSAAAVDELVATAAGDEPEILQRDFAASLHAAFRVDEVQAQLKAAGLTQLSVRTTENDRLVVDGII